MIFDIIQWLSLLSKDFQGSSRVAERRSRDSLIRNGWSQSGQTSEMLISSSRSQTGKKTELDIQLMWARLCHCDCLCTWPFGVPGSGIKTFQLLVQLEGSFTNWFQNFNEVGEFRSSFAETLLFTGGSCMFAWSRTVAPFWIRRRTTSKCPFSAAHSQLPNQLVSFSMRLQQWHQPHSQSEGAHNNLARRAKRTAALGAVVTSMRVNVFEASAALQVLSETSLKLRAAHRAHRAHGVVCRSGGNKCLQSQCHCKSCVLRGVCKTNLSFIICYHLLNRLELTPRHAGPTFPKTVHPRGFRPCHLCEVVWVARVWVARVWVVCNHLHTHGVVCPVPLFYTSGSE